MDKVLMFEIVFAPILYLGIGYKLYKLVHPKRYGLFLFAILFFVFGYVMQDMVNYLNASVINGIDTSVFTFEELIKYNRVCQLIAGIAPIVPNLFYGVGGWFVTKFVDRAVPVQ